MRRPRRAMLGHGRETAHIKRPGDGIATGPPDVKRRRNTARPDGGGRSGADADLMRAALELAARGRGATRPNPAVGCVIVRDGRIVGRGWHRRAGLPHAEVEALRSLRDPALARGATVYVTLEPCCTHGRTPPCTAALIAAGVARVVVGAVDPNPRHRGRGFRLLRRAGITVASGVLADDCAALNREFHHAMATGLPWVIAKCGMSLDGRLTRPPGEGRNITSAAARRDAMRLRARVDAVLVGAGTVRADDPALTVRGRRVASQPQRVVWAPRRPPPPEARIFGDDGGGRCLVLRRRNLREALASLVPRGIHSVLVEGGGRTLGEVFRAGLASEAVFYIAPLLAGGGVPSVGGPGTRLDIGLHDAEFRRIGGCLRATGLVIPRAVRARSQLR